MRILFVCTAVHSHGGIQRFNRNLIDAWTRMRADVDIVSVNDPNLGQPDNRFGSSIRLYGSAHSKVRWLKNLSLLLRSSKYDAIVCGHINLAPALISIVSLGKNRSTSRALILHGIEVWNRIVGTKRMAARQFDRVLAVSRYTAQSFCEQMHSFPKDRIVVFPNTIDEELQNLKPLQQERTSGHSPCQLLSVTRLSRTERDKGILHVFEALSALGTDQAFEYVLVGDGDDRSFLAERAASLGIADRVMFRGALSDVDLWATYEKADIFILPSRKEGFGIVFLEAMRFGLPVIAASEKGALDVVRDGRNGYLVEYGDVAGIRRCLLKLATEPELSKQLGKYGQTLVEAGGEFSYETFCERARSEFSSLRPSRKTGTCS